MKKIILSRNLLLLVAVIGNGFVANIEATKRKLVDQVSVSNKRPRLSESLPNNIYNYFEDFQLLENLVNDNRSEEIAQLCIDNRALHKAIMADDLESVEWILEYTKNYEVEDDSDSTVSYVNSAFCVEDRLLSTPLIEAIDVNSKEILSTLIENGADVNLIIYPEGDHSLVTPLMYAIERANLDMIKLLVEEGAMVNEVKDNESEPQYQPLSYLLGIDIDDDKKVEIFKYLIAQGSDVNQKDPRTDNYPFDLVLDLELYQCLKILIEKGVKKCSPENKDILNLLVSFESKKVEEYKESFKDLSETQFEVLFEYALKTLSSREVQDYKVYFEILNDKCLRRLWIEILDKKILKVLNNYNLSLIRILTDNEKKLAEFLYKIYAKNKITSELYYKIVSNNCMEWQWIKESNLEKLYQDIKIRIASIKFEDS